MGSALHPVPSITEGRSATMASADFCPFTSDVTVRRATRAYGRVRWRIQGFRPGPQSGSRGTLRPPIGQISPDKDMDFPCTTAAFTLSPAPDGFRHLVLTHPGTEPCRRFLSVDSHLGARASFRQALAGLPLPSASSYTPPHRAGQVVLQGTFTPSVHAHAGRTQALAADGEDAAAEK